MDPQRCNFKVDQKAKNQWVANHARQIGQFENVNNPIIITRDEAMEEDPLAEDTCIADRHKIQADLPPIGSKGRAHAKSTTTDTTTACTTTTEVTPPTVVTHLRFGTLEPSTIPLRARGGTSPHNNNTTEHHNMFAPLRQQGTE